MGRLLIATFGDSKPFGSRVNFYQTTRCHNPEDSNLHTHRRENLKSYLVNLYGEATHRYLRRFETLRIKSKLLPDYTVLQPRRQLSSYSPPWEPQILHKVFVFHTLGTLCRTENIQSKFQLFPCASQHASIDCCVDIPDPRLQIFNSCNLDSMKLTLKITPQRKV
jgi:hypothetical protein